MKLNLSDRDAEVARIGDFQDFPGVPGPADFDEQDRFLPEFFLEGTLKGCPGRFPERQLSDESLVPEEVINQINFNVNGVAADVRMGSQQGDFDLGFFDLNRRSAIALGPTELPPVRRLFLLIITEVLDEAQALGSAEKREGMRRIPEMDDSIQDDQSDHDDFGGPLKTEPLQPVFRRGRYLRPQAEDKPYQKPEKVFDFVAADKGMHLDGHQVGNDPSDGSAQHESLLRA